MTDECTGTDGGPPMTHEGEPVSDHETKQVLLVASHDDTIHVEDHGEMTVVERTDTYFGPNLLVADEEEERNYRIVPAGFARDPELWRDIPNERGFIEGWAFVGEVSLDLVDVGDAPQCECGELLQSAREKRQAFIAGVCPH